MPHLQPTPTYPSHSSAMQNNPWITQARRPPAIPTEYVFQQAGTNKFKPQILMLQNPRNSSTNDTAASVLAEVEVDSLDDTSALDACNLQQVSVLPGKSSAPSIFSWPGGHISSEQLLSTGLIAPTSGTLSATGSCGCSPMGMENARTWPMGQPLWSPYSMLSGRPAISCNQPWSESGPLDIERVGNWARSILDMSCWICWLSVKRSFEHSPTGMWTACTLPTGSWMSRLWSGSGWGSRWGPSTPWPRQWWSLLWWSWWSWCWWWCWWWCQVPPGSRSTAHSALLWLAIFPIIQFGSLRSSLRITASKIILLMFSVIIHM